MAQAMDGSLLGSRANFIINPVSCQGDVGPKAGEQVFDRFPHVETEYRKYLRYCEKNNVNPLGKVQYVPTESWALVMVDTMKNSNIFDYDKEYQYIANLFVQDNARQPINMKAMKNALVDVKNKALKLGAKVARPYYIGGCYCQDGGYEVNNLMKTVFGDDVDVEVWRNGKG